MSAPSYFRFQETRQQGSIPIETVDTLPIMVGEPLESSDTGRHILAEFDKLRQRNAGEQK